MRFNNLDILNIEVQWIRTDTGPLHTAHLPDEPVVDYDFLLSLNSSVQEIEASFDEGTIWLVVKPGDGKIKPLTVYGLAKKLRERAKVLRGEAKAAV